MPSHSSAARPAAGRPDPDRRGARRSVLRPSRRSRALRATPTALVVGFLATLAVVIVVTGGPSPTDAARLAAGSSAPTASPTSEPSTSAGEASEQPLTFDVSGGDDATQVYSSPVAGGGLLVAFWQDPGPQASDLPSAVGSSDATESGDAAQSGDAATGSTERSLVITVAGDVVAAAAASPSAGQPSSADAPSPESTEASATDESTTPSDEAAAPASASATASSAEAAPASPVVSVDHPGDTTAVTVTATATARSVYLLPATPPQAARAADQDQVSSLWKQVTQAVAGGGSEDSASGSSDAASSEQAPSSSEASATEEPSATATTSASATEGASAAAATASATVRILPLGDSIMSGQDLGGPRTQLWKDLTGAGYHVDFVGSQSSGPSQLPDKDNEAYSGKSIADMLSATPGWVSAADPDVVLVSAGGNDMMHDQGSGIAQRYPAYLAAICGAAPGAAIVVATNHQLATGAHGTASGGGDGFNKLMAATLNPVIRAQDGTTATGGCPVSVVDMDGVIDDGLLADDLHPNAAGYAAMGDRWFPVVRAAIDGATTPGR